MIASRSDTPTGIRCLRCDHSVVKPWGARRDEYLVCDVCVTVVSPAPATVEAELPDLSDSFWRIATADHQHT